VGDARRGKALPPGGAHLRRVPGSGVGVPTPDVPWAVLVASGAVGALLSLALLLSGVAELAARARNRRASYGLLAAPLPVRRPRISE